MASPDIAPQLRPRPGAEFILNCIVDQELLRLALTQGNGDCHLLGDRRSQPTPIDRVEVR